jgi:spore germination protein YaaH
MLKHQLKSCLIFIITGIISLLFVTNTFSTEVLVYTLREHSSDRTSDYQNTLSQLKKHAKKMTIVTPQAYYIDKEGVIHGDIEPGIIAEAKLRGIRLMPLVTNRAFDKKEVHAFLMNHEAEVNALNTLLANCENNHFEGLQFDFEMIDINDKEALTAFYQMASNLMHQHGFKISYALAPMINDHPDSLFQQKLITVWEGAYDFKAIANMADFVSIMAYDQHGDGTTPGPTAALPWVNQVIQYTLTKMPAKKISLGIPAYSTFWYLGSNNGKASGHFHVMMNALSYEDAIKLTHRLPSQRYWSNDGKYHFYILSPHHLNEYLFVEDQTSFRHKYQLVKKYHLRGISIFDLGTEDPATWKII